MKKKTRKPQNPPLSLLDKRIYDVGILIAATPLVLANVFFRILIRTVDSNPAVIACSSHATCLFVFPFWFYACVSALVYCIDCRTSRKPIFGNKKIEYGKKPWSKNCYPLFSSERKKQYIRPSHRRRRRGWFLLWLAGFISTLLIFPLGLFGRTSLLQDNSIVEYNAFNHAVAEFTVDDYETLTLQTVYRAGGRYGVGNYWGYDMIIEMENGEEAVFSDRDFIAYNSHKDKLERMAEIKSCFTSTHITVKGGDDVDKVADDLHLSDSERGLLYKLFLTN